jgi:threonylcarbamoyladenosine tRNA methylthiotransferase MtaB
MVVGAGEKFNLVQHIRDFNSQNETKVYSCDIEEVQGFHSSFSLSDRTRTFLKVQDGCDYSCTFCTIPLARGHSRSDTIQGVVDNVQELALSGVKEVVLTGVNLGDFGKGFTGGRQREENFYDLVQALDALTVMPRYRISSIEPNLLSEEIIRFVAQSKHFMPHFHIPLQSGSNILLAAMKRRYRRELYQEKVAQIKQLMPHACIGVDVIVGFPGETDELFEETFQFLQSLDISYLHVFTYSERENTPAFTMQDVVPISIRKQRNARLRALSEAKMNAFADAHRTQQREVLFEQTKYGERMEGYTDNYIRVSRPYDETLVNTLSMIEL